MDSVPPNDDSRGRPLTFVAAALWTLLVVFLTQLFIGMTEASRAGAYLDIVSRTGCSALGYSVVFFGILRLHEPHSSIRHVLALRRPSLLALLLALGIGLGLSLPAEWLEQALSARFPRPAQDNEAYDQLLSISTLGKRIGLVATLVVVQPALDELFFRGALFTPLRRTQRVETVVVATAAFETLGNLNPRSMASLLMASLVFAWMRGATGSVFPSIVARMAFYGASVIPFVMARELPKPSAPLVAGSVGLSVLGLLGLWGLSRRSARILETRLEDGE